MTREYVKYQGNKFFFHPYHKDYLASRCGKILSLKWNKKRILKLCQKNNGYLGFQLFENNTFKDYSVHRYIYEVFKGKIPEGMHIDHWDFNKKNNSINNLQILSPKENIQKSKFKKVFSLNLKTKEEKIFGSVTETAKFYQISISTVTKNCQKKTKITQSKKDGKRYQFFYL